MRVTFKCSCEHTSCIIKTGAETPDWKKHRETRRMIRECTAMGRHPEIEVISFAEEKTGQLRIESFM